MLFATAKPEQGCNLLGHECNYRLQAVPPTSCSRGGSPMIGGVSATTVIILAALAGVGAVMAAGVTYFAVHSSQARAGV